jgi:hypothetical protein
MGFEFVIRADAAPKSVLGCFYTITQAARIQAQRFKLSLGDNLHSTLNRVCTLKKKKKNSKRIYNLESLV